ncbi:disease resistance protein RGA2-like [Chenopodium quinoa]|uniref:disease resistance protein RGA2-like n=1 Tax=Chenopodium quinoa TaxID=63459 RepID=UPI000B793FF8|nr:disease resistance protein RGA2-like [Chenopodium quinoa]
MDIVGTTLSVAQTLFAALQCPEVNETLSLFGYKSHLDDLIRTVEAVKAVLLDAESKQELSHEAQIWLQELKDVVYEADDLVDEFVTLAEQKQLLKEDDVSLSKKARHFFSNSNPLGIALKMSRGVKKIKKKLGAIAYNDQFRFKLDHEPIRKRRPETCSYVDATDIIGREDDLEIITSMLLDSDVQRDVSFLTIVGMGGLGKTALTQLVYNDESVKSAFPLRLWACVSDHDQNQLDVKEIVGKILGENHQDSTMDRVQHKLREKLAGKRFLLVLDDVWTENRTQWNELAKFLIGDQRGSWIVATTRSETTARIIGNGTMHKLQGLSHENSWRLFERSAFGSEQSNPHNDLVKIGCEIVQKCAQIPLAIKVAGGILYGQDKSKWLSFRDVGLGNIRESHNDIMPVLKFSYHHLESPLKCCFSYCAVFPKNCIIDKQRLIRLWMAQGYIVPIDKGQSIEEAGEEYISILVRRCFFHNVRKSENGEIGSFMIHDLMHDIAQNVIGKELCTTKAASGNLDKNVRHLSLAGSSFAKYSFGKTHIRSYFYAGYWRHDADEMDKVTLEAIVTNCRCLRALDLAFSTIKSLPSSIGELLHLRYVDLSYNKDLELLSKSITKLYNLQTLLLIRCEKLKELPKDVSSLVKLETLDIDGCSSLSFMPKGIDKLSNLRTLNKFIVGGEGSCSGWKQWFDRLEYLTALNNLKGRLEIDIRWPNNATCVQESSMRGGLYLRHKEHLSRVKVDFKLDECSGRINNDVERRLMEELQPHSNLKELVVRGYHGARMPSWVTLLPNLVDLRLFNCGELDYLPCLGSLSYLKFLKLSQFDKLEHIEADVSPPGYILASESTRVSSLFPSLEHLELKNLHKCKGWIRRVEAGDECHSQLYFPQLKSLRIEQCPLLTCTPWCPKLERLHLVAFNKRLQIMNTERGLHHVHFVVILEIRVFQFPDCKLESLEVVEEVFRSCSSSLQSFCITGGCSKLRSVSGGVEHLTALKITTTNWMQFLKALQTLSIVRCNKLESIPNWMPKLTSLRNLKISCCSTQLERRCQYSTGEDWLNIQHISSTEITSKAPFWLFLPLDL